MAYALVGTPSAATVGTAGNSITPTWGTGLNRTAGNLLICCCDAFLVATFPTTPSGWSVATQLTNANGLGSSISLYYKIAAGSDAAPTLGPVTSAILVGQLLEFSGNASSSPLDRFASTGLTSSPQTVNLGATDATAGELLMIVSADQRSAARTPTDTLTSNVGTVVQDGNNNAASSANHYSFGHVISTTSNASADTATVTCSTSTSLQALTIGAASFKLPPPAAAAELIIAPLVQPFRSLFR